MNVLQKLGLIVWKNLIIRKRHWLLTIFELFMPILLFLLLIYVNVKADFGNSEFKDKDVTYFPPITKEMLKSKLAGPDTFVLYAKNTSGYIGLMENVRKKLDLISEQVIGFENEKTLQIAYNQLQFNGTITDRSKVLAILFNGDDPLGSGGKQFKYTIRVTSSTMDTKNIFPVLSLPGPGTSYAPYFGSGFLALQMMIDETYIETVKKTEEPLPFQILLQFIPYPPYRAVVTTSDLMNHIYYFVLPLLTIISFVFLCPSLLTRIVEEKDTGIKELMKMMGLKQWMSWLGWIIHSLTINMVSIVLIVIILKVDWGGDDSAVLRLSNAFLVWLFLFLYVFAGICFCFFISTLFNKPTIAQGVGVAIWILSYFLPQSTATNSNTTYIVKIFLAILPNMNVLFGFNAISSHEINKAGLNWSNMFKTRDPNDLSMGAVCGMLLFDILFYSLLTWYMDHVKPGRYGLARPWYFLFTKSYWSSSKINVDETGTATTRISNTNYEQPPRNLRAGIKIRDLHKTFNNVRAVDGLTMDLYNGEITALLGHNGAGKTTTMSILTGMFSPSSGHVTIHDYDIRTQMGAVRDILGLCPQHNMLFNDLNVIEHLIFFARLKGKSYAQALVEGQNLLTLLNLKSKEKNQTKTLSGGMKRKLSLAIALVGDAQVLMLDEPTSGMDPEARREVWDMLLRMRDENKVIVITTHFMEEADVLGDRIAIMDHGTLQCYGTSMFLKRKYGAGYHLSLMKVSEQTSVEVIRGIVLAQIPNALLKNESAGLVTFTLPAQDDHKFPKLFHTLETTKRELGITGIGLSVTTLEDVFLRVGELVEEGDHETHKNVNHPQETHSTAGSTDDLLGTRRHEGVALEWHRIQILFVKKFLFTKRKYIQFGIFFCLPILLVILALVFCKQAMDQKVIVKPALDLTYDMYDPQIVFYSASKGGDPLVDAISKTYGELFAGDKQVTGRAVQDVNDAVIAFASEELSTYRKEVIVAGEFNNTGAVPTINAMASTIALHSTAISLNMITNTLLRHVMDDPAYSIQLTNHPLESQEMENMEDQVTKIQIISNWLIFFPVGFLTLIASFINFPIVERVSQMKQLQLMSGLQAASYWSTMYLFDLLIYTVVVVIAVAIVNFCDPTNIFNGPTEVGIVFTLLMLYGVSNIACSYFISFKTATFAGGFRLLLVSSIFTGMIASTTTYVLLMIPIDGWKTAGTVLHRILSFVPHYAVSNGLQKFTNVAVNNEKCRTMDMNKLAAKCAMKPESTCCPFLCTPPEGEDTCDNHYRLSYMDGTNSIQDLLIMMVVDAILYAILIMLVEYNVFGCLRGRWTRGGRSSPSQSTKLDVDVQKEKQRINDHFTDYSLSSAATIGDDNLLVNDVHKQYGKQWVVRGISFGVHSGECFGLLGVNGAGKTTTFRMITGDERPSAGDVIANHYRLSKDKRAFLGQFGYCPQFDALNETLTGREMLVTFAGLRGLRANDIRFEVDRWLGLLGLKDYADRLCGTYSGGNKRKLSTAMALIGEPPIVLLDEPTSGVDPISRRNLWNVLSKVQKQSIVLTSHSMEECEALCHRLAIMVNGQMTCIGSVPYLKQRFGQGFTVIFKIKSGVMDSGPLIALKQQVVAEFDCELKDEHDGLLHYHVTNPSTTWFTLFDTVERLKASPVFGGIIEDYTISETTLEQVFLSFARQR